MPDRHEIIRQAHALDVPMLRKIVLDTLCEFHFEEDPDGIDADLKDPMKTYVEDNGLLDVLTQCDRVVGFIGLIPVDHLTIELRKLYVNKEVRGCGYGGKLLDHAVEWSIRRNYRWMILQTSTRLKHAGALYQSRGFAITQGPSRGKDCDQLMQLDLQRCM